MPSPAPARSAGLRFAVILLSKAMDVGSDHLIHRKRSPFPYEGKDLTRSKCDRDFICRARHFQLAASGALPRCPAGRSPSPGGVGWRGSPLRTNKGADSGLRRTQCIHPRRAERRAQVCGDSTVKSDGRWVGSPHPPQAVPLPLRGEGLNARENGWDLQCRAARQRFARSELELSRPAGKAKPMFRRIKSFPLRGRGTAPRWMR